ncbi:MAG TPA: hypothetical protein VLE21_01865 [Candidatus Nitrosocosmicus sp.]|nr:hypothetical protein [Candidatus Nitrosocosmicus sp.]
MNIKIDTSFFPDHLSQIILNSEDIKPFFVKNYSVSNDQDSITKKYSLFEFPGSIKEFSDLLNSLLQKKSINEYVVAQDMETENTLVVLMVGDIQQLGLYVCDFCGAVFNGENEKYIHQRAHYFV